MPNRVSRFSLEEGSIQSGSTAHALVQTEATGDGSRVWFRSRDLTVDPPWIEVAEGTHTTMVSLTLTLVSGRNPGKKTVRAYMGPADTNSTDRIWVRQ